MKKFIVTGAVALITLSSVPAFAQNVSIPGLGSNSKGSEVTKSTINVIGNKASNVTNGGGALSVMGKTGGALDMAAETNVNSVVLHGSKITNSTVNVMDNKADQIMNIGGSANVNSVVLQ